MKIGDYETAEFALREFIDKNKDHDLAGNAQYWYGETFRIRQLYSDAATAYLDGYQNVIGELVEGEHVLSSIEESCSRTGKVSAEWTVSGSGCL